MIKSVDLMVTPSRIFQLGILLCVFLACSSCKAPGPYVKLNHERFSIELVDTDEKRALGLMFRDSMPDDHGMLFVFAGEARRSFWMKNTRISLDIFYFDSNLALVSVSENTPPCRTDYCPTYPSDGPAKYVLELNAGMAVQLGAKPGDVLELHLDR